MNKVVLIGNLTKDVELASTPSNVSVAKFSLAVKRPNTKEDVTDFFNCIAWRGLGENIAKYCKKGNKIALTGVVTTRTYEDKNKVKHNVTEIVCDEVEFLTPKESKQQVTVTDADDDVPF